MKFGLKNDEYELLNALLIRPLVQLGSRVWIFGSRARGDHKPFSDVDVMFELPASTHLPSGMLSNIKESLEESALPYKVDIVNLTELAEAYRSNALCDRIEVTKEI